MHNISVYNINTVSNYYYHHPDFIIIIIILFFPFEKYTFSQTIKDPYIPSFDALFYFEAHDFIGSECRAIVFAFALKTNHLLYLKISLSVDPFFYIF